MHTIALMNPAGSTAKSTTAAALAQQAVEAGRRVLAVDLDPQANLSEWLGANRAAPGISQAIRAVVANDPDQWPGVSVDEVRADLARQVERTIQHTGCGVDVIAADHNVRTLVRSWSDLRAHPEQLLADLLAGLPARYSLVVLDCKGDLGVLSEAALRAADDVIGVATPTTKALEGLQLLAAEVAHVGQSTLRAIIPSQIRPRNHGADANDLFAVMIEQFGGLVTRPVRGGSNLEGAYTAGQPITQWAPASSVAVDLAAVHVELSQRGVLG